MINADISRQHHKLITTEARRRVAAADLQIDPLGRRLQCQITSQVTIGIVDGLEVIQIQQHAGHGGFRPLRA